jgi:hypothetical protein
MPEVIQSVFVSPSLAFARLGSSTTTLHAYHWVRSQVPRVDGETTIAPAWTLAVQPDATVRPFKPDSIAFRDGDAIRPVAPFFEVWARLGEPGSAASSWRETPLTPALLSQQGITLTSLRLKVNAQNLKAARRTGDRGLGFGTHPEVIIAGDDHTRVLLQGVSPSTAVVPMIPIGRHIPLGAVQMLRSSPQPADEPWSKDVNVEVIRFRFTPAAGLFYGPPDAALAAPQAGRPAPAVRQENAFLNRDAGWRGARPVVFVQPGDTYDVLDNRPMPPDDTRPPPSLGVVDDTCEVHFEISLQRPGGVAPLAAKAIAFVGPPDFGPDRRPFLSVADELNDRVADAAERNAVLAGVELDRWVEDLFERIYETVSLFNVDRHRPGRAAQLPPEKLQARDVDGGQRAGETQAMGGRDALRNQLYAITGDSTNNPLPLSEYARMRHRALSDLQNLIELVALDPSRLKNLVRAPFEVESFENGARTSMRMPAFMRQSNALPLTLTVWQYELLMRWVRETAAAAPAFVTFMGDAGSQIPAPRVRMSHTASERRAAVLTSLDGQEGAGP